jgi:hypothetical protein
MYKEKKAKKWKNYEEIHTLKTKHYSIVTIKCVIYFVNVLYAWSNKITKLILHRSECQRFPIFWFVNRKKPKKHTSIKLSKEIWINASHNQELSLPRWERCSFPIFWIRKAFVRMSFILPLINPLQSQCQNERPVRWDRTLTESRKGNMFLFES